MHIQRRDKYISKFNNHTVIKNTNFTKIDLKYDIHVLDLMCYYVITENEYIKRNHFINMRNLFEVINPEIYKTDSNLYKRFLFIQKALEARLNKNFKSSDLIIKYANGGLSEDGILDIYSTDCVLTTQELSWISETITIDLKYSFLYYEVDKLIELCMRFKSSQYFDKESIVLEFEAKINEIKNKFRQVSLESINDSIFSLKDAIFNELIRDIHNDLQNPGNRILTGNHALNELTYGGFESERVYMFFGLQGEGKSVLLLNLAYQIKKYNKHYICKDKTKRPAVVLLTMENSIKETVERLFDIATGKGEMQNLSVDEVINILKTEGDLLLSDDSPVDLIIKYAHNGSVDTTYLYTLVEDLEDEGIETIAFIQDYVFNIRPCNRTGDFRLDLGNIINEFKTFAIIKGIPVITASQINRDGAKSVDTAKINNKTDLARTMGRSNVAESMNMVNNIDFGAIMQTEYDSEGKRYIGFNRFKIRGKKLNRDVLYTPFDINCPIKLCEDFYEAIPFTLESLRPDFDLDNDGMKSSSRYNKRNTIEELQNNSIFDSNKNKPNTIEDIDNFLNSRSRLYSIKIDKEKKLKELIILTDEYSKIG